MGVDWDTILAQAASDVRRRFWGYAEREDLVQEGWLWRLTHEKRYDAYDQDEKTRRGEYRLRRDLVMAMEQHARREKASRLGYDIADEAFYSATLIGLILPMVLDEDYDQPQVNSEGRGSPDPAEGGTWMAHREDVAQAWLSAPLTDKERDALCMVYGLGMPHREAAQAAGCDHRMIGRRVGSGLKKMQAALGGEKPRGCPYDCECHDSPLRRRPGVRSEMSGKNQELR